MIFSIHKISAAILLTGVTTATYGADIWPIGREFPIGMYTVSYLSDIQRVAADGFNLINSYSFSAPYNYTADQYVQTAALYGLDVMMPIGIDPTNPGLDIPAATVENVLHFSQYDNVAWWYYTPEEPRYWIESEMQSLRDAAAVIRANDPLGRPIYTYLPNGYNAEGLANYAPYLDGIGAGDYANYVGKPRPWVRWQIEQDVNAIQLNGNPPGQFPVAVLQMYPGANEPMTGNDAYHDAYLSLVTGAKAILIYGDAYRDQVDPNIYQSYKRVAHELNGPSRLGDVFLFGNQINALQPTISAGPQMSASFTDSLLDGGNTIQYPSVSHRVMTNDGKMYLVAVNSAEQTVTAAFPGIRDHGDKIIHLPLENRTVSITGNQFMDAFYPLGVHVYQLPSSADLIINEDSFNSLSGWSSITGGSMTVSSGIATVNRGSANTSYMRKSIPAGSLPEGGFIELSIYAERGTFYSLQLFAPDQSMTANIQWQEGTGQWQTVRDYFAGDWRGSRALYLGIQGGNSYQVDSLGIYYTTVPEPQVMVMALSVLWLARQRPHRNISPINSMDHT